MTLLNIYTLEESCINNSPLTTASAYVVTALLSSGEGGHVSVPRV
jgi:hypothetical protein